MFNEELNAVKKELTQKSVPLPPSHPKYAGQAHWARTLKKRIERSMMVSLLVVVYIMLISHLQFFKDNLKSEAFCKIQ